MPPLRSETGVGRAILSNKAASYSIERSVGRRVIAAVAAVTIIVFSILYILAASHLQDRFDAVLLARADAIVSLVDQDEEGVDADYSDDIMPEYSAGSDAPFYLQIRNPDGSDLVRSGSLGAGELAWTADIGVDDEPEIRNIALPDGQAGRQVSVAFLPRLDEDEPESADLSAEDRPLLLLALAGSRAELDRTLFVLLLTLAGSALLMAVILVFGIGTIVRRGLEPLREGSRQIEALDASDLSARVRLARSPQEMKPIIGELNRMLARVEEAFARESRFNADVAHELRTPLAELAAASEVAQDLPDGDPAIRRFFADVREVTEQMSRLVEILLTLSRCENGTLDLQHASVDLPAVLQRAVGEAVSAADDPPPSIVERIPTGLHIMTHEESLRIILGNLLRNAVQHSPPGSAITCSAEKPGTGIQIAITNPAPGLRGADLDRIFERFWQRDRSRTSAANFGLGLPLVKALSEALGLELRAALDDGQLTVTLSGIEPVESIEAPLAAE